MTARERLLSSLAPDVVEAIDQLIAERVRAELEGMAAGNGSPWLALDEAAAYLRVSERTLERMIARSRVRSSTVGRRRLVHRDELDALVRAATGEDVAPTTPSRHREA